MDDPRKWSRQFFINGACSHYTAEPVTTVDGVHVGYVCPKCDAELPVSWSSVAPTAETHATSLLIAAGFDPLDAVTVVGHAASDCPVRLEVTSMGDPEPQYAHGMCGPKED